MATKDLTTAQCVLLTVHLASESNVKALHSFTPSRPDALNPELVLRILLTYLPEALDPREYTAYFHEVASNASLTSDREDVEISVSSVKDLTEQQARKRVRKLHLLPVQPPQFPSHAPRDLLTRFICHRAYRIDAETGLLNLVQALIQPFLDRNEYLRTWYISVILPLLRLQIEYYPDNEPVAMSVGDFEKLDGREGVDVLLRKAALAGEENGKSASTRNSNIGRDMKGLVGPWMYGDTERKRRKLDTESEYEGALGQADDNSVRETGLPNGHTNSLAGHDWKYLCRWMVDKSVDDFGLVARAVEDWGGPDDVDLGGNEKNNIQYLDEEQHQQLNLQYAQAAFASCYATESTSEKAVRDAHTILSRLSALLNFNPPPDLATSVELLPRIERHEIILDKSKSVADLQPDVLIQPDHPLTTPRLESYMLLQMLIYSAFHFSGLGYPIALVNVAKLHFFATPDDQLQVLRRILHGLSKSGTRKDEGQLATDRRKLLWLWSWGVDSNSHNISTGHGVLGKIDKGLFEEELLKVFLETNCYQLATNTYMSKDTPNTLTSSRIEGVILEKVMEVYDSASNGNRSRGGMKKASDILAAFRPHFSNSVGFSRASALIAATHSLSFYSLTLQHGVPFQPVSIHVSADPISLISTVLEQNPRSYTKLDDLVSIARNLVLAGLAHDEEHQIVRSATYNPNSDDLERMAKDSERRVTFMAVEASLREDDFETAYSYIVNRLTPSGADAKTPETEVINRTSQKPALRPGSSRNKQEDDCSWRAAFLAGRFRPAASSPPTVRRLEQRTELLSLALLLAPVSALTEILAAWRRCEEETRALQISQQQAEDEHDDRADKRLSGGSNALPGNFTLHSDQPDLVLNQKRRELGRMGAAGGRRNDDTPLSMFDLTRNAARAFSKNAFPLQGARRSSDDGMGNGSGDLAAEEQQRVRKRDMVANAVSGGLASGLGWVLGAKPVNQPQE